MEHFKIDVLVIGAGVIGLAIARAFAQQGREVWIAERGQEIGGGISSRNSEVIHAGIYYPKESLKARFCVQGNAQLYAYCQEYDVPHHRCGKLIVASDASQFSRLQDILKKGQENGVNDLQLLEGSALRWLEPELRGDMAILSPSTGIIDSHALMQRLSQQAQARGANLLLATPVHKWQVEDQGLRVELGGADPCRVYPRLTVNAAGLQAVPLLRDLNGFPAKWIPDYFLAKGNYFSLTGKSPFSRLIYPLPEEGGLGVHLTLDMGGQARFGPDVQWVECEDYRVDTARQAYFEQAIRCYWPTLPDNGLQAAYAGIRPKLTGPGGDPADFIIQRESEHGIKGLINLLGIESPGLTSCLAIADDVCH